MEPITITPDPTGFAAKLSEAQATAIAKITQLQDLSAAPGKIATLSDINSIIQWSKIVKLQGDILTELQVLNSIKPENKTWIDEAGNYYQSIYTDGEFYTYAPNGEIYIPTGKSRPVDGEWIEPTLTTVAYDLSEPKFTRRQGTEQLVVEAGARYICIIVSGGEVSCSNGDGVLIAGIKLEFTDPNGMTELIFDGDTDADYLVATRYPVKDQIVEVEPEDRAEETDAPDPSLMTGDLLPIAHDLTLDPIAEFAA